MAVVTSRGSIWNTNAGVKTVTATPAVGDLIVVIAANSGRTVTQPPTITDNNSSGTYAQLSTTATRATNVDSMWAFVRTSLIGSATSTIFTMTPTATDTGGGFIVYSLTLMARVGTDALRQGGKQDNIASGTPSVTMGSAILTANPVVGAVMTGTNGTTNSAPPTGFTEAADLGYNTPPSGFESVFRSSGETRTTVPWTAASPSAFCSMLLELDTSAAVVQAYSSHFAGGCFFG